MYYQLNHSGKIYVGRSQPVQDSFERVWFGTGKAVPSQIQPLAICLFEWKFPLKKTVIWYGYAYCYLHTELYMLGGDDFLYRPIKEWKFPSTTSYIWFEAAYSCTRKRMIHAVCTQIQRFINQYYRKLFYCSQVIPMIILCWYTDIFKINPCLYQENKMELCSSYFWWNTTPNSFR